MRKAFEIQWGDILIASRNIVIRLFWGWGWIKHETLRFFMTPLNIENKPKGTSAFRITIFVIMLAPAALTKNGPFVIFDANLWS